MTNHSETTGSSENGDITGREGDEGHSDGHTDGHIDGHTAYVSHTRYEGNAEYGASPAAHQVTLRTPGELADALPYLLGYRPEDSIVLVALHDLGGRGRFGGRARLGIPANPDDWGAVARQLAQGLVAGSERRGNRPAQMVAYLCQEPAKGETGRQVMERLQSLAHQLRVECGRLDIPVIEALCISDGHFWSYCCGGKGCCPVEGVPMGLPGTSVLAAAATYAGIQVRGTLRELRARLLPLETAAAVEQEVALDTAGMALIPRILDESTRAAVGEETLELAGRVMRRFAESPVVSGMLMADHRDDELLGFDEAAALILGLQDRVTRDRAAAWMEGDEAAPALRLWRALARRCVGPYGEHAAAPLTLAGWVAWSSGDELEAREALAMALGADPAYLFARLLHQACNEGLDPESVRRCLRAEREERGRDTAAQSPGKAATAEGPESSERSKDVKDVRDAEDPDGLEGTEDPQAAEDTPWNMDVDGDMDMDMNMDVDMDRSGEARDLDRPDEVEEARDSGPHGPAACASWPASTPPLTTARRRRRTRAPGVGVAHEPAAAGAVEGQEPPRRAQGTNGLRSRTPSPRTPSPHTPHTTHPTPPSRGGSRPRPAGKASPRRRGSGAEGARPDGDEATGKA
ncbi:DUF4192 domain-containing protein [Streptomyces sp. ME18-1-4]|uniref:DUF4192 domain-containing protein n=1 Tax=Streptomyces sp. ME18-1-4 TaxID=3028685 RepID=UPI0029B703F0|nr:DUF4192 domain-containing protein [Streptomyces sp. ME18-1-4]MDX3246129.1 DUF4192 domain-containing protein [Streptomyces sp. ME18-1-4]